MEENVRRVAQTAQEAENEHDMQRAPDMEGADWVTIRIFCATDHLSVTELL
jgi:hypothetical protein